MTNVHYQTETTFHAKGRNGFMHQHGLSIVSVGSEVCLEAITSKGHSDAARLVVPIAELRHVIDALTALNEGRG